MPPLPQAVDGDTFLVHVLARGSETLNEAAFCTVFRELALDTQIEEADEAAPEADSEDAQEEGADTGDAPAATAAAAPAKVPRWTDRGARAFAALDTAGTGAVDARQAATLLARLKSGFGEVGGWGRVTRREARGGALCVQPAEPWLPPRSLCACVAQHHDRRH